MSLLTLLSLQDEQIEVVTEAVRHWCEEGKHDIDGERGRAALQAAIAIAMTGKWDPAELPSQLRRQLDG